MLNRPNINVKFIYYFDEFIFIEILHHWATGHILIWPLGNCPPMINWLAVYYRKHSVSYLVVCLNMFNVYCVDLVVLFEQPDGSGFVLKVNRL